MSPIFYPPLKPTPQEIVNGGSAFPFRESFDRRYASSATQPLAGSGIMNIVSVPCYAGDIITNITFRSGTQAAVTPTAWWFALYNPGDAGATLIAQTADQTTTAWAATNTKTLALVGGPFTIPTTDTYNVGIMMAAGTMINITGATFVMLTNALVTGQKRMTASTGSGLTTNAPGTLGALTNVSCMPYVVLS